MIAKPHSTIISDQASLSIQFLPSCCDGCIKIIATVQSPTGRPLRLSADRSAPRVGQRSDIPLKTRGHIGQSIAGETSPVGPINRQVGKESRRAPRLMDAHRKVRAVGDRDRIFSGFVRGGTDPLTRFALPM
jgi:hypothetical protein